MNNRNVKTTQAFRFKNSAFLVVLIALLTACTESNVKNENATMDNKSNTNSESIEKSIHLNNPIFFMGGDFGTFYFTHKKMGNADILKKYTCNAQPVKDTIQIIPKLKLRNIDTLDTDCYMLHYTAQYLQTEHLLKMQVCVENDTCRFCGFY